MKMKIFMHCLLGAWIVLLFTCQQLPATEEPMAGQTWADPVTGMEFVWVPEGEFLMGCGTSGETGAHGAREWVLAGEI